MQTHWAVSLIKIHIYIYIYILCLISHCVIIWRVNILKEADEVPQLLCMELGRNLPAGSCRCAPRKMQVWGKRWCCSLEAGTARGTTLSIPVMGNCQIVHTYGETCVCWNAQCCVTVLKNNSPKVYDCSNGKIQFVKHNVICYKQRLWLKEK